MALEIERKYLVDPLKWKEIPKPEGLVFRQGYISVDPVKVIRVRITDKECFLTIKGALDHISRSEYDYEIPRKDAEELFENFTVSRIEKVRYKIRYKDKLWELDEFSGENKGLLIAEIELTKEDDVFEIPNWVSTEVTHDERYYNVNLAQNPYSKWKTT